MNTRTGHAPFAPRPRNCACYGTIATPRATTITDKTSKQHSPHVHECRNGAPPTDPKPAMVHTYNERAPGYTRLKRLSKLNNHAATRTYIRDTSAKLVGNAHTNISQTTTNTPIRTRALRPATHDARITASCLSHPERATNKPRSAITNLNQHLAVAAAAAHAMACPQGLSTDT